MSCTGSDIINSNSWSNINACSLYLTAGTYILSGTVVFPVTGPKSNRIGARFYNQTTSSAYTIGRSVIPYRDGTCAATAVSVVVLTASNTIWLQAYQQTGEAVATDACGMNAVRIA